MLGKALTLAAAIGAMAAAAACAVVALAFALYAALLGWIGPAWASAGVAGAAALLIFLGVMAATLRARAQARAKAREAQKATARLTEMLKDTPFAAGGAALAAGVAALRSPELIGFIMRTLLEVRRGGNGGRRRKKD